MIYKKSISPGKKFNLQVVSAQKHGEITGIAEFNKTIYAVLMHYVKTGERCFPRDTSKRNYSLIRFKEKTGEKRIHCGFGPSGLIVLSNDDRDSGYFSVAVARSPLVLKD